MALKYKKVDGIKEARCLILEDCSIEFNKNANIQKNSAGEVSIQFNIPVDKMKYVVAGSFDEGGRAGAGKRAVYLKGQYTSKIDDFTSYCENFKNNYRLIAIERYMNSENISLFFKVKRIKLVPRIEGIKLINKGEFYKQGNTSPIKGDSLSVEFDITELIFDVNEEQCACVYERECAARGCVTNFSNLKKEEVAELDDVSPQSGARFKLDDEEIPDFTTPVESTFEVI